MAHDFAARKGYAPPAQELQPTPELPKQTPPQMGNQAKVLTTGQAAQTASAPITPEYISENMGELSKDQLWAMLGQPDGRKFLR
jgi:hypothetical protein